MLVVEVKRCSHPKPVDAMPSLIRFLTVVGIIGGVIYGGIYALANFVQPKPREMTVGVPNDRFLKK